MENEVVTALSKFPVASKIIDVRVDWMDGYGNSPSWSILLDSPRHPSFFAYPDVKDPVTSWEHRDGLYRAESGIFVNFKAWGGKPDSGFGGSSFPIILKGGEKVVMKGPWSSRAGCANRFFHELDKCVEFSTPYGYSEEALREDWKRPYFSGLGGVAIRAQVLIDWLKANDWTCQHLHNELDDGRRTNNHVLSREKVRVAWATHNFEPTLIPLHADGTPKDSWDCSGGLEEVT